MDERTFFLLSQNYLMFNTNKHIICIVNHDHYINLQINQGKIM